MTEDDNEACGLRRLDGESNTSPGQKPNKEKKNTFVNHFLQPRREEEWCKTNSTRRVFVKFSRLLVGCGRINV